MKTDNYMLTEEFKIYHGVHSGRILPAGSFVKPIELVYLPKHVTDHPFHKMIMEIGDDRYCYTRYGIVLVPKNIIRKAS